VVEVKTNADDFDRRVRAFARIFPEEFDTALNKLGARWLRGMAGRLSRDSRNRSRTKVRWRTGRLARSFFFNLNGKGGKLEGKELAFGSRMPGQTNYAGVHELGTRGAGGTLPTIRPTRSQYLAIPLQAAFEGTAEARPTSAFRPDSFVLKAADGRLFIVRRSGDGLQLLFKLQKTVDIPPRLGMRDTMRSVLKNNLRRETLAALDRAARKAFVA